MFRSAPKRKATPAAESLPNVQASVASKTPSLYYDPTQSALSDQPQKLVPQILSPQTPSRAETLTQTKLLDYVLPNPSSLLPITHNLNQQTPSLANATKFS